MSVVAPPEQGNNWVAIESSPLPVATVLDWATQPDCGGVVLFSGTVRDHAEGRPGVSCLEYEAYTEQALVRMTQIASEVRVRWAPVGRVGLLHRTGPLAVGECAVVVVVSTPHRAEAFAAAQWAIDTLKATVPIWKKETWDEGSDWGTGAQTVAEVRR
jgi:molybdopterin synthase catalytic subunit